MALRKEFSQSNGSKAYLGRVLKRVGEGEVK